MFVGCVVAGSVIMASGGVPARGALMRDMASVVIAVSFIGLVLASGSVSFPPAFPAHQLPPSPHLGIDQDLLLNHTVMMPALVCKLDRLC